MFSSLLTMVSGGLLGCGISQIYKGKLEKKSITKGIIMLGLGFFGIAFFNPLFESLILSVVAAVIYSGLMMGFISNVFLNVEKPEEIVYKAELFEPDVEEKQQENLQQPTMIERRKDISIPLTYDKHESKQMIVR